MLCTRGTPHGDIKSLDAKTHTVSRCSGGRLERCFHEVNVLSGDLSGSRLRNRRDRTYACSLRDILNRLPAHSTVGVFGNSSPTVRSAGKCVFRSSITSSIPRVVPNSNFPRRKSPSML